MTKEALGSAAAVAGETEALWRFFPSSRSHSLPESLQRQQLLLSYYAGSAQESLAEDIRALRAQRALAITQRAELATRLQQLLAEFPLLHLKGAAFNLRYYGALGLRDFEDVDLLLRPEHIDAVQQTLLGHGFERRRILSDFAERRERRSQHAVELIHSDSGIEVDLHWCLVQQQYALPDFAAGVWERAEEEFLGECRLLVPASIDTLSALLVGAAKDSWRSLRVLLDIYRCLAEVDIDELETEYARFQAEGCALIFLAPLALLARIFPENAQLAWVARKDSAALRHAVDELAHCCGQRLSERAELRLQLQLRESLKAKLGYAFGRLCIPHQGDWDLGLGPMTYAHKPLKTLLRALRSPQG